MKHPSSMSLDMPLLRQRAVLSLPVVAVLLAACGGGAGAMAETPVSVAPPVIVPTTPAAPTTPVSTTTTTPTTATTPTTPTTAAPVVTPASYWPAAARADAALAGQEPARPATVCASVAAGLVRNSIGLLDDAIDAATRESQPDAARLQAALDACPAGQAVKLVAGSAGQNAFLSGPLTLPPAVSLWIDGGVTLFASRRPSDYQIAGKNACGEASTSDNGCQALLTTSPKGNGLYGDGVIDGRGGAVLTSGAYAGKLSWWDVGALTKTGGSSMSSQNNPRLLQVNNGSGFTVYRMSLHNAPKFHLVSSGVDGLTVWDSRILTPTLAYSAPGHACAAGSTPVVSGSPNLSTPSTCFTPETVKNTDGIDPGQSTNVLIAYNHISTGDDGIAVKSHNSKSGPVTGMRIWHNRLYFTHGMSIGSETDSGVDGVSIRDLAIDGYDMSATSGVRIKTDDSRGGKVANVSVDGVCARRVQQPIAIDSYYGDAADSKNALLPDIHDITVRNFRYLDTPDSRFNGAKALLLLRGYQSATQRYPLYNIVFDNLVFDSQPGWVSTRIAQAVPSNAALVLGPGPVSFASVLAGAAGQNQFSVKDQRSGTAPAYDCSTAFVPFPSSNAPMSQP